MATVITAEIRLKRGHAQNWRLVNPTLGPGEPGFEIDTYKLKIGDGETAWNNLPYFSGDFEITADGNSVIVKNNGDIALYGFDAALSGQVPSKAANGKLEWTTLPDNSNKLIPAGGSQGQVLAKSSATDYAVN